VTSEISPLARQIQTNMAAVKLRIAQAATAAGRHPSEISVVAVTKTHPLETIRAAIEAGILELGENYAQEFEIKHNALQTESSLRWHFIGNLQSNKASIVTGHCSLLHTIDRQKIASVVSRLACERGVVQDVLIQARLGDEDSKSGAILSDIPYLRDYISNLPGMRLRGLMAVAPLCEANGQPAEARKYFDDIKILFDTINIQKCDILSIGMSGDYLDAIAAGSTMIRIGSAIFGARASSN